MGNSVIWRSVAFKFSLTIILLLQLSSIGWSQSLEGCGTEPYKDPWLTEFQHRLAQYNWESNDDSLLYIPVQLHVLGDDNGIGYLSMNTILRSLCTLNEDFVQADIQFFIQNNINYLDRTQWFRHGDIDAGAEMMFTNNVDSALNCYIVQDPAGNCGYNLPYAGIALGKSCMGANDHTWSHEVGHHLSIPHPFLGWEGGQTYDGSVPPQFDRPAPATVTYNYTKFKDKYYTDTLIIDTAIVEMVDGSNCRIAADGFCDTAPDYLAQRWTCNGNGVSATVQTDPTGATFRSEGQWLMSYVSDNCSTSFSEEQIAAMRANIREQKTEYVQQGIEVMTISPNDIELVSPQDGDQLEVSGDELVWNALPGATHYILQVSRIRTFGLIEIEQIVPDTSVWIDGLIEGRKYYWRVIPFNSFSFCKSPGFTWTFTPANLTNTIDQGYLSDFQITQMDGQIHIGFSSELSETMQVELISTDGKSVVYQTFEVRQGDNDFIIDNSEKATGAYFLRLLFKNQLQSFKLIKQI